MPYLSDMILEEFEIAIKENWPVIIPSGCIEFHGNHLPLGTDLIIVEQLARRIESFVKAVIAPSFSYGPTGYAVSGAELGTIDVRVNIFKEHAKDVLSSLYSGGFRRIIVIQHHQGDNGPSGIAFKMAAAELFNELCNKLGDGWYTKGSDIYCNETLDVKVFNATLDTGFFGGHGGLGETEAIMGLWDGKVDMSRLVENDYIWNWKNGNCASEANVEMAKEKVDKLVENWVDLINKNYR